MSLLSQQTELMDIVDFGKEGASVSRITEKLGDLKTRTFLHSLAESGVIVLGDNRALVGNTQTGALDTQILRDLE